MAISIKHNKVSLIPDSGDASLVEPSDWNAEHTITGVAASGANTDITSLTGITGAITSPTYVGFDTTYATTLSAGQLGWDGNNTLGLGMAGGNVIQHIGEDQFFYIKASSAITKGQVIMFTGAIGASGVPTGAPATGVTDGTYIMGVAAESIAHNGFGLVQCFGSLRNVNTSGYADGDILWYDPSVTGGLTKTKPSAPNIKVQMAAVINGGSAGGGSILIRVDPGSQLGGTDSNVQITSPTTGQSLVYDSGTGIWTNSNANVVIGGSVNNSPIGASTASTGKFTTLESTGTASLGTTSAQYIQAIGDATYPQVKAAGSGTNIPLVLQPKGTGALQAQQTDSTATGGNARGTNAVDWQTSRGAAVQVASGANSGVLSGLSNTASGGWSVTTGGRGNTAFVDYSAVVGGRANSATGFYNFVGGGELNTGTATSVVTTQAAATNGVTSGSTAVTLAASNASIKVGQIIFGTGIQSSPSTYVAAISGTSLTLSQNATATGTPTLSFYTPHGVVVGGGNNQATGSYSFIGGGGDAGTAANRNAASGAWSTVTGGLKNVASNIGSVVCGGGTYDGTGTGQGNTSSGLSSFVSAGWANSATNDASHAMGAGCLANGAFSTAMGQYASTRAISGNFVISPCVAPLSAVYTNQVATLVLARQTTDATATVLTSTTSAAGTTNQVILPNNSAYLFKCTVIAGVTGAGNTSAWKLEGAIKRGATAGSTAIVGTVTTTLLAQDVGAATWAVTATADTTNGGLKITVTGQAATTIRWVCKVETTEMTY